MEEEIRQLIKHHYKRAIVRDVNADLDDTIALNVDGVNRAYLAKRLLDRRQGRHNLIRSTLI